MIYITTKAADAGTNNQWVIDNLDPAGSSTFVPNRQDSMGAQWCLISLPDNGSDFVEGMKSHFGFTSRPDPVLQPLPSDSP